MQNVIVLSVIILNVTKFNVTMQNVIVLSVIILNVTKLNVIMLNVIIPSVVAPKDTLRFSLERPK
jgi:hypothetical protein